MEKIVNRLINDNVKGVDTYFHNGSMWLIFTDKKEWIIELEKGGNLWYNYGFFLNLFKYLSLDVVENQHYITKWVEDIIQNGVRNTGTIPYVYTATVEGIIQNGVRDTLYLSMESRGRVVDTIKNGVKDTNSYHTDGEYGFEDLKQIENVIQNGNRQ